MNEFIAHLDTVAVPLHYEQRFLDTVDSAILTADERLTLAIIIAHAWLETPSTRRKRPVWPYGGVALTKDGIGYRTVLSELPPVVCNRLYAYIYLIVG